MDRAKQIEKGIVLKTVGIFAGLSQNGLYQIADALTEVNFPAGVTIFNQGDPGDCLYIIVSGKVRVHQGERTLNYLHAGHVFGEMAMLDSEPRLASVTTEQDTRLYRLDQAPFYALMAQYTEVQRGVIRTISRHLRERVRDLAQAREELERYRTEGAIEAPNKVGAYEMGDRIGMGGMSQVYKGHQAALNRTVAIKILSPSLAGSPEFRARFEREAKFIAALSHPNIVTIYDYGNRGETYYIAMEYVNGVTLEAYLEDHHPLSLPEGIRIIREVAAALDYAHERNLVHRDIKLDNVMMEHKRSTTAAFRRVLLMDFGISKDLTSNISSTVSEFLGTAYYMPPEQIFQPESVDKRADIYSLGVMAYRLFTKRFPFEYDNMFQVLVAHQNDMPVSPHIHRLDMPIGMGRVILRALEKMPYNRHESAGQFAEALEKALNDAT